jgi:hypothetical protein
VEHHRETRRKRARRAIVGVVLVALAATAGLSIHLASGDGDAPAAPELAQRGTTPRLIGNSAPSGTAAGSYRGETEQRRPVTFTVSGGRVTGFEAGVNTWCTTQYNQRLNVDSIANVPPMPIGADGSFGYDGDHTNGNMAVAGRVTGAGATGTVGMNRGDTNYSGGMMYFGSCSASGVKWSADVG